MAAPARELSHRHSNTVPRVMNFGLISPTSIPAKDCSPIEQPLPVSMVCSAQWCRASNCPDSTVAGAGEPREFLPCRQSTNAHLRKRTGRPEPVCSPPHRVVPSVYDSRSRPVKARAIPTILHLGDCQKKPPRLEGKSESHITRGLVDYSGGPCPIPSSQGSHS